MHDCSCTIISSLAGAAEQEVGWEQERRWDWNKDGLLLVEILFTNVAREDLGLTEVLFTN